MALPGLLVEYLVSGALALPWLSAVLGWHPENVPNWQLPLLGVLLYVVGMAVDFAAFLVTRPIKWRLRKHVARKIKREHQAGAGSAAGRQVRLMKYSPEVAKEVAARSSRDRIARGALLNAAIAMVVLRHAAPWWHMGLLFVLAFSMWIYFEGSSYMFELRAEEAMEAELKAGSRPSADG